MTSRILVAGCLASLTASLVFAASLAAQTGRDLQRPASRTAVATERLVLTEPADTFLVPARVRRVATSDQDVVGVRQAATALYQYDDDSFENFYYLVDSDTGEPLHAMELAQRFRLSRAGAVEYAEACLGRGPDDTSSEVHFVLSFYSGAGDVPTTLLEAFEVLAELPEAGTYTCFQIGVSEAGLRLGAGPVWVGVSWMQGDPPGTNTKLLAADENGSGGRRAFRGRASAEAEWEAWQADTQPGVYGIRLAVDHPDQAPDPVPDPDPDPDPPTDEGYTDCVPQTTPLRFDGGYSVQMCYETAEGDVGEGKAGIWASGESGLLWFFNRDNAEVLVKVLDGCALNGHRWVFVAPVTDLAFNLRVVDSSGGAWSHRNRLGDTASTRSDTQAFRCGD